MVARVCFSPQADLVGGLVVGAIGIDAIRHVDRRPGHVALAALPLLLGAHQVVEAFVWWGLQGSVPSGVGRAALWIYLLIALVVLPIYVPTAVFLLERDGPRRWEVAPFVAIGAVVAVSLFVAMLRGPVTVTPAPYRLAYAVGHNPGLPIAALYILAVCGAFLVSGHRILVLFGLANLIALPIILWLAVDGFASLWCGYAAAASAVLALYLRFGRADTLRGAERKAAQRAVGA